LNFFWRFKRRFVGLDFYFIGQRGLVTLIYLFIFESYPSVATQSAAHLQATETISPSSLSFLNIFKPDLLIFEISGKNTILLLLNNVIFLKKNMQDW
jgi:hypothetical protein